MSKRKPRELLAGLLEELGDLRAALLEDQTDIVDFGDWEHPLMSTSTQFLRDLADFRDGVQEAASIYPDEWFERLDSPDLEDPDLLAWHELSQWFMEHGLMLEADLDDDLEDDPLA